MGAKIAPYQSPCTQWKAEALWVIALLLHNDALRESKFQNFMPNEDSEDLLWLFYALVTLGFENLGL